MPWTPRLGVIANIATGDHRSSAGDFGTFNSLFPAYGYFIEAALVLEANIIDVHPSITLHPLPSLTVSLGTDVFWPESARDGFYQVPIVPLIRATPRAGRAIGSEAQFYPHWQVDRQINIAAAVAIPGESRSVAPAMCGSSSSHREIHHL